MLPERITEETCTVADWGTYLEEIINTAIDSTESVSGELDLRFKMGVKAAIWKLTANYCSRFQQDCLRAFQAMVTAGDPNDLHP